MVFRLKPLQRNNPPKNKMRLACYRAIQTKVGLSLMRGIDACTALCSKCIVVQFLRLKFLPDVALDNANA